uniref:Uncharacterized protein n=1 Tax=Plectus sambesii TaxID=2011161 RepID=A0A914VGX4_9BILA
MRGRLVGGGEAGGPGPRGEEEEDTKEERGRSIPAGRGGPINCRLLAPLPLGMAAARRTPIAGHRRRTKRLCCSVPLAAAPV